MSKGRCARVALVALAGALGIWGSAATAAEQAKPNRSKPPASKPAPLKKGMTREMAKVVDLIEGLQALKDSKDKFTTAAQQQAKELALVDRILGPSRTLSFEFKSFSGDQSPGLPLTGGTWLPWSGSAKYDAETKTLRVLANLSLIATRHLFGKVPLGQTQAYATLPIVDVWTRVDNARDYVGSNAYGTAVTVERLHTTAFGFILADEAQRILTDNYDLAEPVQIEPDEARELLKRLVWRMTVEVLQFDGAYKAISYYTSRSPTIDDPRDLRVRGEYLPVRFLNLQVVDPKTERAYFDLKRMVPSAMPPEPQASQPGGN